LGDIERGTLKYKVKIKDCSWDRMICYWEIKLYVRWCGRQIKTLSASHPIAGGVPQNLSASHPIAGVVPQTL